MKKNYFFKPAIVAMAALCRWQKTMAVALLMLIMMGGYASAQTCSTTFSVCGGTGAIMTSTTGGGMGFLNGVYTTFPSYDPTTTGGVYTVISGVYSGGKIEINHPSGSNGVYIYGYITGRTGSATPSCLSLVGDLMSCGPSVTLQQWTSSGALYFQANLNNYTRYWRYFMIPQGGSGEIFINLTISSTPPPPGSFAPKAQNEDGPKIVNLTEIVAPVVGEADMKSFPFLYKSASAWGDFNNDGFLDLMIGGISHYELDGEVAGIWHNNDDVPAGAIPVKHTYLYKNNGDGTFTEVAHTFPKLDTGGITWLDYDNDGNLDVFIAGSTENMERYSGLWRNLGPEGNYEFEEVFLGAFEYFDIEGGMRPSRVIAAGDYDNDGWVDLAFIGRNGEGEEGRVVSLYRNLEGQDFLKIDYPVKGEKPFVQQNGGSVAWGDYNGDGLLDLISFGYISGSDEHKGYYPGDDFTHGGIGCIYTNNGDGTFSDPWLFHTGEDGQVAWFDYNNDGKLDFAFGNFSWWNPAGWYFELYENTGNGAFTRHDHEATGFPGDQTITMDWGDINNDGYEDAALDKAGPTAVFMNNFGDGTFQRMDILFDTGDEWPQLNLYGGCMSLVDFDNDGDLDIFSTGKDNWGRQNTRSHLVRNDLDELEGLPANQAPTVPTNLQATVDADGITTFTWNASTDDLTPQAALRYNLYVKQNGVVKSVLPASLTTGRLKVNETLAPIMGTTYKLSGLAGATYEWGVQAIDNGKQASAFAVAGGTGIAAVTKTAISVTGKKQAIEVKTANALQGTVSVYSVSGMSVYSKAGQINGTTIALPAGVYIVKITSQEGTAAQKAIVQ